MCNGKWIRLQGEKRKQKLKTAIIIMAVILGVLGFGLIGTSEYESMAGIYHKEMVLVGMENGCYILEDGNGNQYKVVDPPEITFDATLQNGKITGLK